MTAPDGSIIFHSGLHYKVGRHDKVYYWNDEEWIKCEKSKDEIRQLVREEELNRNKAKLKSQLPE